jgi:hypothetical protein
MATKKVIAKNTFTEEVDVQHNSGKGTPVKAPHAPSFKNLVQYQDLAGTGSPVSSVSATYTAPTLIITVDGISGGVALPISGANLSYTPSPTNGIVNSDTGTNATIPIVNGTHAGLATPAMLANSHVPVTVTDSATIDFTLVGQDITAVRAALTGDVTASADSNTTTIANNAVTNAKLADMPANTLKGNATGLPEDPQDLTVSQVKTLLSYTATDITNTPAGNISSTNLQTTVNELDSEKQVNIQFQNEGVNQGVAGGITTVNFTGVGTSATAVGSVLTVDVPVLSDGSFKGVYVNNAALLAGVATPILGDTAFVYNSTGIIGGVSNTPAHVRWTGISWEVYDLVYVPGTRLLITDAALTAVNPGHIIDNPLVADVQLVATASGYKDTLLYYTGTVGTASNPLYAYWVDISGNVTQIKNTSGEVSSDGSFKGDFANLTALTAAITSPVIGDSAYVYDTVTMLGGASGVSGHVRWTGVNWSVYHLRNLANSTQNGLLENTDWQKLAIQVLTDNTVVSWNVNNGNYALLSINNDRTLNSPSNAVNGELYVINITALGADRTITFDSVYKAPDGSNVGSVTIPNGLSRSFAFHAGPAVLHQIGSIATPNSYQSVTTNGARVTYKVLSGTPTVVMDKSMPTEPVLTITGGTIALKSVFDDFSTGVSVNPIYTFNGTWNNAIDAIPIVQKITKNSATPDVTAIANQYDNDNTPQILYGNNTTNQVKVRFNAVSTNTQFIFYWPSAI